MAKQSLFEAVASAMSKANHARDELRNLDQRAWKMQATPKSWAKNADRFNSRAAALEADARRVGRMSGVDDVDRKSVDEIADEMYDSGLYPIEASDIDKLNITGSSSIGEFAPDIPYAYIPIRSGESGRDAARDGIKQFREYNTKPVWTSDLLKFRNGEAHAEDALREYQKSGPRYRK